MRVRLTGGERTEPAWLYGIAGALMLGGPFGRELYVSHYPAVPEAFVIPLVAGAIGMIVAVGSRVAGGLLGSMMFGGLLFAFADIQFNPQNWTYTGAVVVACILIAQLFARHRAALVALALGAFYATSIVRPAVAPPPERLDAMGTARSTKPVLVHIVLDAQWGIGGLRAAGDSLTADFLTEFYLSRGFDLYEAAYSRYMETDESIQGVMLLGETPADWTSLPGTYQYRLRRNPYFSRLNELGYAINVYQTTYIDFCSGDTAVVSCDAQSGNSIANIGHLDGSWLTRGVWATRYFLSTRSHVFARLVPGQENWRRALAGGGIAAGRHLARAIAEHPSPGTAWFVHVLFPHRPFQANEECQVHSDPAGYLDFDQLAHPSDSLWREVLRVQAGQIRCAHKVLAGVLGAVDSTVGRDQSIVIVQGDHGARLHRQDRHDPDLPLAAYSASELNAHFSALLAVRLPEGSANLHREPTPIQDVIWALARQGFTGPLADDWTHYIRKLPYRKHTTEQVRPLTVADMPWVGRPD